MRKYLLFIALLVAFSSFSAGNEKGIDIDSVLSALKKTTVPKKQIELHILASEYYNNDKGQLKRKNHLLKAEKIALASKNNKLLAQIYLQFGDYYYFAEDTPASINYHNKALLVVGGLNAPEKIDCYNKLGILYANFNEHRKSIDAYQKGIALIPAAKKMTGKEYERLYNNIALTYTDLGVLDSAKLYHQLSLKIRLKRNDMFDLGQTYNNLGDLYYTLKDYDSSLYFSEKGLYYRSSTPNRPESSVMESTINVGKALIGLKKYGKAKPLLLEQYRKAVSLDNTSLQYRAAEQLMELYSKTNNYKNAYTYSQIYHKLKDSIFAIDTKEEIIRLNYAYVYAEKRQNDSLVNIQKEIAESIKQTKEKEIRKQKEREVAIIEMSLGGAILLMGGIIVLVYRNYKSKKTASETILEQKKEVEVQRDIAESQKNHIQEIHKEITDSINYAKRIQTAILPSAEIINPLLKDYFIFYLPKAIVAGDFYWFYETDNRVYFAAADCTGHGVPGAMVSVVCSNALNRAIVEFGLRIPGEILDKTNELLIEVFVKSNEYVKDGMDIALCCLDKNTDTLTFSGANNPLYIVSAIAGAESFDPECVHNETHYLIEIKGTKQPIGWKENTRKFVTHTRKVKKGDIVYTFSDGYPDQFGGERGKKYMYKPFQLFILGIQNETMEKQSELLHQEFRRWKGDLEQVDDVCIIGVKIDGKSS